MKRIVLIAVLASVCVCCKRDKTPQVTSAETIVVDPENSTLVDIDKSGIKSTSIVLENAGENSLVAYLDHLFVFDSVLLISSNDRLMKFGWDGKFKGNISMRGRAGNEYIGLSGVWNKSDTIYLYDMNGKKAMEYSLDNRLLSTTALSPDAASNPFQALVPLGAGYVGKLVYKGGSDVSHELGYYDSQYAFKQLIGDAELKSGLMLGYPFSQYGDTILYWRQLENIIYSIDGRLELDERYRVDFGKKNVPQDILLKDEYDIIDFIEADPGRVATFISGVNEDDRLVVFNYTTYEKKHLAVYDKKQKTTRSFYFKNGTCEIVNVTPVSTSEVYILSVDEKDNNVLSRIDIHDLE